MRLWACLKVKKWFPPPVLPKWRFTKNQKPEKKRQNHSATAFKAREQLKGELSPGKPLGKFVGDMVYRIQRRRT